MNRRILAPKTRKVYVIKWSVVYFIIKKKLRNCVVDPKKIRNKEGSVQSYLKKLKEKKKLLLLETLVFLKQNKNPSWDMSKEKYSMAKSAWWERALYCSSDGDS